MGSESMRWSITQSTPVSIAVVLGLCCGAFWTGSTTSALQKQVDNHHEGIKEVKALASEIAELAKRNQLIIEMNEHRIQNLEDS